VGSIYISVNNVNPSVYFGGTWEAFATGKTLVGIDPNDTSFDTVEKTGGEKTHTLTVAEMPSHTHQLGYRAVLNPNGNNWTVDPGTVSGWASAGQAISSVGGSGAHNNLQPYIVVYMWKRTA
jgi:microcystin-dependent protein